jgi:hypothetical protein
MGDPLQHSRSSAKRFGGTAEDYLHIHTVMDSSKLFLADWRHRALLHNTFGIHIFEQLMGSSFKRKSDGVDVCTRSVITQHILEDLGAVPTPGEFLREMPLRQWMSGIKEKDKLRMQTLTIEGDSNKEAYITSSIIWKLYKNEKPEKTGYYLVSVESLTGTDALYYDVDKKEWRDPASSLAIYDTHFEYWAELPITPMEKYD